MRWRWLLCLGIWLATAVARADEAPPNDYVERCTLKKTCPLGQECVLCPADYRDYGSSGSVCQRNLAPLGFKKQCKSWGASVWDEVWCRPVSGASDASVEIEQTDAGSRDDPRFAEPHPVVVCKRVEDPGCDGCALANGQEPPALLGLLGLAAALGVFAARRLKARRRA